MTFAAQLQAAKGRLSARQAASAVSPLLSVRTMEKWIADEMTPPAWTHQWILSAVRADEGCRDWPCEVVKKCRVNGNPHMSIQRGKTPREALRKYRQYMEATHQHLGAVTLTVATGKSNAPTCELRTTQRPRSRKGQLQRRRDKNEMILRA